jgi:hypothetical protein
LKFETFTLGDLSFLICLETGALRAATYHGEELIRGAYVALRDEHWGTADIHIEGFWRTSTEASWISTTVSPGRKMVWECSVRLETDGFEYRGKGRVLGDLDTRRAGLCVLHPPSMAGTACVVESPDGKRMRDEFPKHVAFRQPFWNVAAFEWMHGDVPVRVGFEGETFETEDQRNWGDASYKTYCRPHAWPQPYPLSDGEVVNHAVRVRIGKPMAKPTRLEVGLMLGGPQPVTDWQIDRLRSLNLDFLGATAERLAEAVRVAGALAVPIQLHARTEDLPAGWEEANVDQLLIGLEAPLPATQVPVVRMAWENFTELNGAAPSIQGLAGLGFGLNPQVHAFDARSIMEIPPMAGFLASEAWELAQGRSVVVAPIAFERGGRTSDPRFYGELGGDWTKATLETLCASPASRAAFFATHGPGGVLTDDPNVSMPVERALRR